MTSEKFNAKYRAWTEPGFEDYGPLEFESPKVTEFLDNIFRDALVYIPGFQVSQIKIKWGGARFYSKNVPYDLVKLIEQEIDRLIALERENE
jgi:hypothetical protein